MVSSMEESFVLRNATCVNGLKVDYVIHEGVLTDITAAGNGVAQRIIDCSDVYVSSGWIDLHVHAFPALDPYGDEIDEIGIKQGVTTVVDAGSCGADRMRELAASRNRAKTNLFAFLNISRVGLSRVDELSDLAWLDQEKAVQTTRSYEGFIVGLKARMSKSVVRDSGIKPLHIARSLSDAVSLPLMVHIGSGPPAIEDIVRLLHKRDIITHYLHGKPNNLFDGDGKPLQVLLDALRRGVHLDVGHGTASFSFRIAEAAKRNRVPLHTISTDIYRGNRLNGPVYGMAHVLSKFLHLGYTLEEVIAAVTVNAANWLRRPELGRIRVSDAANLTLFTVKNKPLILTDSEGETRLAAKTIKAVGVVVNGEFIEC